MNKKIKTEIAVGIILVISFIIGAIISMYNDDDSKITDKRIQKFNNEELRTENSSNQNKQDASQDSINKVSNDQAKPEKISEIKEYTPNYRSNCNENIYCGLAKDDPSYNATPESEFNKNNLEFFNNNKYINEKFNFKITLPKNIMSFYVYNPGEQEDSFAESPFHYIHVFYFSQKKCNFGYSDHSVSSDLFQVQIFDIKGCNKDALDDKENDFCNTFVFNKETSGEKETKGLSYDTYFGDPVSRWVRNDKYLIFIKRPFCEEVDDGTSLSLYK